MEIHVIIFLLQTDNEPRKATINDTQKRVNPLHDDGCVTQPLTVSFSPLQPLCPTCYRLLQCSKVNFLISSSLHPFHFFLCCLIYLLETPPKNQFLFDSYSGSLSQLLGSCSSKCSLTSLPLFKEFTTSYFRYSFQTKSL